MAAQQSPHVAPTKDLARLQSIEQSIIGAVDAAGSVTEELANFGPGATPERLQALCQEFLGHIKSAQALVLEATTSSAPERGGFEATTYQSMARAHLSAEKVAIVDQHVRAMQAALDAHEEARQRRRQQPVQQHHPDPAPPGVMQE